MDASNNLATGRWRVLQISRRHDGCPLSWRDHRPGIPLMDGAMAVETVIGRIGGNLIKRLVDLIKQAWQNRPIMHIIQCQLMGNDFPRCLINTQMQLSPDTALVNTVSADLPLPFTKYFQPGAVDYQMQGAGLIIALQTLIGNLHSACPAA